MAETESILNNEDNIDKLEKISNINFDSKNKFTSTTSTNSPFLSKTEEIKFFLREYSLFENEKFDFYYIIPFKWLKLWDEYIITNNLNNFNKNYPEKIDNIELLDENEIIKPNLIENVDYVIVPKNVAYFFHDVYKGGRRLKTKNRHIYTQCENIESEYILNLYYN
jgi:hypothetical protein